MKWLLGLLLLINLALPAYFNLWQPSTIQLKIDEPSMSPEKIRLMSPDEIQTLPKRTMTSSNLQGAQYGCYEWGMFTQDELAKAQSQLARLGIEGSARQLTEQEAVRYWVYIPGVGNARQAQARMSELRTLGVTDMVVVQDQQSSNVISLGVFKDEQLATKLLEDLRSKGVSNAVKGIRNQEHGRSSLYISSMPSELMSGLESLKAEFPGSEIKLVTCQ
jgi:hypothetical protein